MTGLISSGGSSANNNNSFIYKYLDDDELISLRKWLDRNVHTVHTRS